MPSPKSAPCPIHISPAVAESLALTQGIALWAGGLKGHDSEAGTSPEGTELIYINPLSTLRAACVSEELLGLLSTLTRTTWVQAWLECWVFSRSVFFR